MLLVSCMATNGNQGGVLPSDANCLEIKPNNNQADGVVES
jgi:hypothetical protein